MKRIRRMDAAKEQGENFRQKILVGIRKYKDVFSVPSLVRPKRHTFGEGI
jgi:hypothetical protein